jgi:Abortive infection C-terminus
LLQPLPDNRYDKALMLRDQITSLATGGVLTDGIYRILRAEFFDDIQTRNLLPQFIRTNLESVGIWAVLKEFHTGTGAYAARRKHINEQFQPLLDFLSDIGVPSDVEVTGVLSNYNGDGVNDAWQKALARRKIDPEGAITTARTLLEEVCKHILEDAQIPFDEKCDLPKLYSSTAKLMNLAPSQHTEETFKRILGGCHTIVENLGALRNKVSDAHGGGRRRVRPSERHAALAVNLAGSMAMFLTETWAERDK